MTENYQITLAIKTKYVLRQVWSYFSTGDDCITILNFPVLEPPKACYSSFAISFVLMSVLEARLSHSHKLVQLYHFVEAISGLSFL